MKRSHLLLTMILLVAAANSYGVPTERATRCVRLESRMTELRHKLRLGYSAKQGRAYRQKLALVEQERRRLCR